MAAAEDLEVDLRYAASTAALFARQPGRIAPGLERITTLVELLGRPDQAYPSIQLTGTNGKTTTALMITALLSALGLKAGTYTSPHLQDVRERIRVAGEPITREDLIARIDELEPYLAEVDARHPGGATFFEVLTGLAFAHFADAPVDVAVMEVGLGGRWDATNVARGEVAVLTRIDVDHAEYLGSTPAQIALEKSGVIKDGAAVISAAQWPQVAEVIEAATAEAGGRLVLAGRDFAVLDRQVAVGGQVLELRGVTGEIDELFVPLAGPHQAANAACALVAVEGFLGFGGGLDPDLVRQGFAAVRSPGRLEVVSTGEHQATIVLDGAHNPLGASALAATLRSEFAFRHRVVVLGVLGDKDVEGMVEHLAGVADHVVVTPPPSARAADPERVAAAVAAVGISVEVADDVPDALERARGIATAEDAVVVTGSLSTVGAARDALGLDPA